MGPPLAATDRVLVRMPSWVGDCVAARPALFALAAAVGGERLTVALPRALTPLVADLAGARLAAHDRRGGERPAAWVGHDVAVLFTGSFRSAWTALRAGVPRRVGWSRDGRGALLTDRARPALERGATPLGLGVRGRGRRWLPRPFGASCAELVGLVGVAVRDPVPRLPVEPAVRERVRLRLEGAGLPRDEAFLLASVGGRPGSAKAFPAERWGPVLAALARRVGLPAVLVFGPGEEEAAARARAGFDGPALAYGPPAADLGELAALARESELVVTADGGARHVAAAAGARAVVLHGPTDPRHAEGVPEERAVLREALSCAPCHHERCPLPGDGNHRCMLVIDPERVAAAAEELLFAASPRASRG